MKDVMMLTGAEQIGMAIARRMGYGMKIVIGDKRLENAEAVADTMNKACLDKYGTTIRRDCDARQYSRGFTLTSSR